MTCRAAAIGGRPCSREATHELIPFQGQGILTPVCRYHAASLTRLGREVRKL
jgi:hypothetical protein